MARKPLAEFAADTSIEEATDRDMILALEQRGFTVHRDQPLAREIPLSDQPSGHVRFGVVSDTHLGHQKQQLTFLRRFYEKATEWRCEFMLHAGDIVDGQNMHRDQQFELFRHGVEAQAAYAAEHLPVLVDRRGRSLPTYAIGGNHDGSGWNDVGANVVGRIADRRPDFTFLGAPTATFNWGPLRIRLMHPDGGVAYARSYKLQKIVEQMPPDDKPHMLLCGHWHVACHLPGYRNVEAFALPCFEAQTAFIARKGLAPVVGGVLFDAEFDERGLTDLTTKWCLWKTTISKDWP